MTINDAKTRVRKQGQQQEVTGIVVNYKPQLARSIRKDIRKDVYYIKNMDCNHTYNIYKKNEVIIWNIYLD